MSPLPVIMAPLSFGAHAYSCSSYGAGAYDQGGAPCTTTQQPSSPAPPSAGSPLSPTGMPIIGGLVFGALLIVIACVLLWRRRKA